MSSKCIGVIVRNQEGSILYQNSNYYIKVNVHEKDSVDSAIQKILKKSIKKTTFRVVQVYKGISELAKANPNSTFKEEMDMYLVEVGVYNNEFKFLPKEDIFSKLKPSPTKDFFEKYIIKFNNYKEMVYQYFSMLLFIVTILVVFDTPFKINIALPFDNPLLILAIVFLLFFMFNKYFVPKIAGYLLKFDISDKFFKISKYIYNALALFTVGICLYYTFNK